MNRLLQWLFGKKYCFEADFYRPPWDENPEWKHLSGLFRWGGILNKPAEGKVRVGSFTVYLAPNATAKDVRWDFLRADFDGYMDSERVFCPDALD